MEDVERAYVAGLFDGEGSTEITFSPSPKPSTHTQTGFKDYPNCRVQFIITNTEERVLKEIHNIIDGKGRIYCQKRKQGKDLYRLVVYTPPEVKEIVGLIKPFVRVKSEELKNLGEATDLILKLRGSGTKVRWTENAQEEFIRLAKKSRTLRGSSGSPRGRPRKRREVATLRVQ